MLTPHKAGSSIYGYGDFDGPGLQALVDEMVRRTGASLPFGATLRGSPAGAGGGLCPLGPPQRQRHMKGAGRDLWVKIRASEAERERTRELARIGANLNQIARWANTFKANAEAVEIVAHLVAIERALAALAPVGSPDPDAH